MDKKLKKLLFLLVLTIIFVSTTINTFAFSRLGTGKISGGADNLLYYIDSSASEYNESISYGIQFWNSKSTQVSIYKTVTKSYSRCDNYWGAYYPESSGIIAVTELILNNQITTNYNIDWYWCKIKYNSPIYKYLDGVGGGISYDNRKGTACHEYGHFLGLAHSATATNIMCQLGNGRTALTPSTDDVNGIKSIYGN